MEKEVDIIEAAEAPTFEEMIVLDDLMPTDGLVVVDEPHLDEDKEFDLKKNRDLKKFIPHLQKLLSSIPPHSGKTTAGCERAMAHLDAADRLISQVIVDDTECELDDQAIEKIRKQIRTMKKQLKKRHKEINDAYDADDAKYASEDKDDIFLKNADGTIWRCPNCHKEVKPNDEEHIMRHKAMCVGNADDKVASSNCSCTTTADKKDEITASTVKVNDDICPKCNVKLWKAAEGLYECISCDEIFKKDIVKEAGTAKIQLIMSPFERAVAGAIINSFVSQGKNPEQTYAEFKKKYAFTDRDELSIQQVLMDMGYPILKDRGHLGDKSEQLNNGMGVEFSTQYTA